MKDFFKILQINKDEKHLTFAIITSLIILNSFMVLHERYRFFIINKIIKKLFSLIIEMI